MALLPAGAWGAVNRFLVSCDFLEEEDRWQKQSSRGSVAQSRPQDTYQPVPSPLRSHQWYPNAFFNNSALNNYTRTTTLGYSPFSHYPARTILLRLPASSALENVTQDLRGSAVLTYVRGAPCSRREPCSWKCWWRPTVLLCCTTGWEADPENHGKTSLALAHRKAASHTKHRDQEEESYLPNFSI